MKKSYLHKSIFTAALLLSFFATQAHSQTLIDFTGAPSYPAKVDSFSTQFSGITLSSGDQWFADSVNNSYFQNIRSTVLSTFSSSTLTITFNSPAQDVRMDLGSGSTLSGVTIQVVGYYAGTATFTNSFVTVKGAGGGYEVRAQTSGVVDEIRISRISGSTTPIVDNLYFTTLTSVTTVTANPSSAAVCGGNNVSFSATATSSKTPSVQWQLSVNGGSFNNIPDATNTTYSFTATTADSGNRYRAYFTDGTTSATTAAATLTVITSVSAPSISSWDWVCPNEMNIEATGNPGGLGSGSAQGENGSGESANDAFDGDTGSKWLDFANDHPDTRSSWLQYQYDAGARFIVTEYSLTSANDAPERDPKDWQVLGSNDGTSWTTLDIQTNQTFASRQFKKTYTFSNSTAYHIYRLQIDSVKDPSTANSVQLAEFDLVEGWAGSYNYSWAITNGVITSATNLQTITYNAGAAGDVGLILTIAAGSDCVATQSFNVPIDSPSPPDVTLAQTNVCPGSTGNQATADYEIHDFTWTITNGTITSGANSNTVTYTVGGSGVVTLTVTADNGESCPATATVTVPIVSPAATIALGAASVCGNSTGNTATGPADATSYAWTISNGTITGAANEQTVTYTAGTSGNVGLILTVANSSGCSASTSTNVTINAQPTEPTIVTVTNVCPGAQGNTATAPSGFSSYAWTVNNGFISGSSNSQTLTFNAPSDGVITLSLTVGNESGCTASSSIGIPVTPLPGVDIIAASEVCANSTGNTASAPSGAGTYAWTINNGTITSATNLQTITFTAGATGNVQLILLAMSSAGCSSGNETDVAIAPAPTTPNIVAAPSSPCPNSSGNLATGPAGMSGYGWSISNGTITSGANSQTAVYTADNAGNVSLSLVITNSSGCVASGSTNIFINLLPSAGITLSATSVSANSTGNTASAPAGASSYAWSVSNGTIISATNTQSITYAAGSIGNVGLTVVAGNSSGCTVSSTTNVTINAVFSVAPARTESWLTNYAGKYARIYTNDAMKTAGTSITTWSNGTQNQTNPAYCGIQEIYSSTNWVYIRTTGLGTHIMGPWYLGAAHATIFPNLPANTKTFYRFPVTPTIPATNTLTGLGAIGYFVDGVAMFDSRDAFYWNGSTDANGSGSWNRDAYVNESVTFDPGLAHQENTGTHHYHANPIALRYLLNDHITFNNSSKTYSESTAPVTKHSPILGWVRDGYPVYGPYGFSNATNANSGVRRMISGYQLRNGSNGTDNLATIGRTSIPQWAVRFYNISSNQSGPTVSSSYPLGRYMEDNAYLGDLGKVQGVDFDLDEYNGRYCVTPEFPNGTYAYFVSISSSGAPAFPYNIGRAYRGNPTGGSFTSIAENVSTNFLGALNQPIHLNQAGPQNNTVTLTWNAVEGGVYQIDSSTNLPTWNALASNITPVQTSAAYTNIGLAAKRFYRAARTGLAAFDSPGTTVIGTSAVAPGGSAARGTTVIITITLPSNPPNPSVNVMPASVTLGGTISGTNVSRPSQSTVQATFTIPGNATTGLKDIVVTFSTNPVYTLTGAFTIN